MTKSDCSSVGGGRWWSVFVVTGSRDGFRRLSKVRSVWVAGGWMMGDGGWRSVVNGGGRWMVGGGCSVGH